MSYKKTAQKKKSTFIDGIAASEHLDSSGERIDIKGMDISSLTTDGVLNFEHKSAEASQIVGKIIKAKKIFERKDCENDRQRYFWDKIKTPYLYVVGELFDAVGHQGAKDVAAMLRYDEMNKEREDKDIKKLINFSVEGQKLEKRGSLIKKCIARKISITITPCNKVCEAEELKDTKDLEKSDKFSIVQDFMQMNKGEKTSSCQLLKAEYIPKSTFTPQNAPDKIKAGYRIDYSKQPKVKTGKEIYGAPPKMATPGRPKSPGSTQQATPAQGKLSLVPKPDSSSPADPLKFVDPEQKYAQTNRRYATIPDLPKKKMIKNKMRKAIIASTGMGSPGTKVNDLSKEDVSSNLKTTCEPKTDLMKPYASDAQRRWAHTKAGKKALGGEKAVKEWDKESKGKDLPEKVKKSKNIVTPAKEMVEEHKHLVNVLRLSSHKGDKKEAKKQAKELKEYKEKLNKSEASKILSFVQSKYPEMEKSQQVALAKTVAFLRKSKKDSKPFHGYSEKKHSKSGGLNDKYREKYNKEHGTNLKRPVTSDNPKGEAKNRKKSFCARMSGVKGPTSKDGKLTPKGAALKRWKCSESEEVQMEKNRCWDGYEPVPGKKPYSEDSCRKKTAKKKTK